MGRLTIILLFLFIAQNGMAIQKADFVLVDKSESKLYLINDDKIIKEYKIALGGNPAGHKQQEGDERTPEGRYLLDYKNENSKYYKAIHISYPNDDDKRKATTNRVNPGGQIMIHGQRNGFAWLAFITQWFNWTDGCIAVTNSEMHEIWQAVDVGTPIEIQP